VLQSVVLTPVIVIIVVEMNRQYIMVVVSYSCVCLGDIEICGQLHGNERIDSRRDTLIQRASEANK
jgi:hypothetical protein